MDGKTGELMANTQPKFAKTVIKSCAKWHYGLV